MSEEKYVVPMMNMDESPTGYELVFKIPGVGKDAVELNVENRSLTLKTHASYEKPAGFKQVVCEFEHVNYAASVELPETADPSTVTAKVANGELRVNVGKRAETQARRIEIM